MKNFKLMNEKWENAWSYLVLNFCRSLNPSCMVLALVVVSLWSFLFWTILSRWKKVITRENKEIQSNPSIQNRQSNNANKILLEISSLQLLIVSHFMSSDFVCFWLFKSLSMNHLVGHQSWTLSCRLLYNCFLFEIDPISGLTKEINNNDDSKTVSRQCWLLIYCMPPYRMHFYRHS